MKNQYDEEIKKAKRLLLNGKSIEEVERILRPSAVSRASIEIIDDRKTANSHLANYKKIESFITVNDIQFKTSKL